MLWGRPVEGTEKKEGERKVGQHESRDILKIERPRAETGGRSCCPVASRGCDVVGSGRGEAGERGLGMRTY